MTRLYHYIYSLICIDTQLINGDTQLINGNPLDKSLD